MTYHDYVTHNSRTRRLPGVAVLVATLLSVMLLAGCSPSFGGDNNGGQVNRGGGGSKKGQPGVFASGSTMARIQKNGKLRVGITFTVPPYASRNAITGAPEGFDIDMVNLIATGIFGTRLDGKVEYLEINPRERELALEQDEVDMVVGRYDITPAKKNFVDFAGPSVISHQVLIAPGTKESKDTLETLLDLNGKKVCVVRGSTNTDALKASAPQIDMSTVQNTVAECGSRLSAGTVAAIAADAVDSRPYLVDGQKTLRVVATDFGQVAYGVGLKKDVVDLRQYVNDQLADWKEWQRSASKWFNDTPGQLTQPRVERY